MFVVASSPEGELAVRVRELRGERTLSEMAQMVGIRHDELGKIERGETSSIRFDTLLRMCQAFGVGVGDLLVVVPTAPKASPSLYDLVLAGVLDGTIRTSTPVGRGVGPSGEHMLQDLDEAAAVMAGISEPEVPRARRMVAR